LQGAEWGRTTLKGERIYLHIFEWPSSGKLEIPVFPVSAKKVSLQSGVPLSFDQSGQNLVIDLPTHAPDEDVSVVVVDFSDPNKALASFSPEKETRTPTIQYIKKQAITNGWINSVLNGLIAFFTYRLRGPIPYSEAAIDILITVFIIAYLISWLSIGSTRTEIIKGNLPAPVKGWPGLKLPRGAGLSALLISMVCVVLFGGFFMDGLLYLLAPGGFNNWGYFVLKTLYTGLCAALASSLTIQSVVRTERAK
jgi:hypothetical protein